MKQAMLYQTGKVQKKKREKERKITTVSFHRASDYPSTRLFTLTTLARQHGALHGAFLHIYKRLCLSIGPWVSGFVGLSIHRSICDQFVKNDENR